jgi:hypothetical protein
LAAEAAVVLELRLTQKQSVAEVLAELLLDGQSHHQLVLSVLAVLVELFLETEVQQVE